jgi:hypothetical protein
VPSKRRVVLRRILLLLAAAVVLAWIASYWFPSKTALLPFGDTALGFGSEYGWTGIVQFDWNGTSGPWLMIHYWHLLSFLAIAFGLTYLGRGAADAEPRDATDVAGAFPMSDPSKRQN